MSPNLTTFLLESTKKSVSVPAAASFNRAKRGCFIMTAKEFLASYTNAKEKIIHNRRQIASAERRAWEICSAKYFSDTSKFEDRLWEENEELFARMAKIERTIDRLESEKYRQLLFLRYIEGKKWSDIAETMCYSVQHIHRMHKLALGKLDELL